MAFLGSVLDSVPEAAFLVDARARVREVNPSACRLLGYGPQELLALTVPQLDPALPAALWPQRWERLADTGPSIFEGHLRAHDATLMPVETSISRLRHEGQEYALMLVRDISERRRIEQDRLASLHYFECMDQVNLASQAAGTVEELMAAVLDVTLSVLGGDRAFLRYPCDPDAASWTLRMERARQGYGSGREPGATATVDTEVARAFRTVLRADGCVTFDAGHGHLLAPDADPTLGVTASMSIALRPKLGKAWQFGVQQCSRERIWTPAEQRLFTSVGTRLADALTALLAFGNLQKSEARFRRIVDTANEGIWVLGPDSRTTFVNARLSELLGYRPEEMTGRPPSDFMFEKDIPDYLERAAARRQGEAGKHEHRYRRSDGRRVWAIVSATPIMDPVRGYQGTVAMYTDITEKKVAEKELRRLNDQLEERVRDRTRQLEASHQEVQEAYRDLQSAHAQLLQQEKLASIGQLAAGIAHEINTPTQYVGDNLTFLEHTFADVVATLQQCRDLAARPSPARTEEIQAHLARALEDADLDFLAEEVPHALAESAEGVRRVAGIVRALKDFAHPSGEQKKPVELDGLIRSTVEICRNEWKLVAELDLDLDPELPAVPGRRDELGQVLLALVVNAAQAIVDAGPGAPGTLGRIRVRTRVRAGWVEIEVRDSGCGIPAEQQRKIFEPFFTTKEVGRGSGQGLAIAYDIVTHRHGGELRVDSLPGEGATFTVRLPLIEPAPEAAG